MYILVKRKTVNSGIAEKTVLLSRTRRQLELGLYISNYKVSGGTGDGYILNDRGPMGNTFISKSHSF